MHIGVGYGRCSEVNNFCAECGSISLSKWHGQGRYQRMPLKKNKKECEVSGDMSPCKEVLEQVKRSADKDCGHQTMRRAYSAMKLGNWEFFRRNAGTNESSVNGPLKGFRRLM